MTKMGTTKFAAIVLAGLITAAPASAKTILQVGGSGGPLGGVRLLAKAYMKAHPDVEIKVLKSLGSSGGIKAVMAGSLDVAFIGRPLKEEEKAKGVVEVKYLKSPYVFITHQKVKTKGVTLKELEQIYGGQTKTWANGEPIRLVVRPEKDSDSDMLRSISPGMAQGVKAAVARAGNNIAITDQDSIDMVAKVPSSLGGATLAQILTEKLPVRVLELDGVKPSVAAMKKGTYPIGKVFYLVTGAGSSAAAKDFAAFFSSPAGKKILAANGGDPL